MKTNFNLHDAFDKKIFSGQITFWTAMINEVIPRNTGTEQVLEIGSWDHHFLPLLSLMRPYEYGLAVSDDLEYLERGIAANHLDCIEFEHSDKLSERRGQFDVAFSTEIFSGIGNLREHAEAVFDCLKDGGEYYSVFGCHIENPLWPHRRRLLIEEGLDVFDYSLEEVADVFHSVGFEVGIKRLPVEYFNIYEPEFTRRRALSLKLLVDTTYEHKMLFYFRRYSDDEES